MIITIKNEAISLSADTLGAQLMSIKGENGCEYLWQGDPAYWSNRAPNLFPFIARLTEGSYTYNGERFSMPNHGFAAKQEFIAQRISDSRVVFSLAANEQTRNMYPREFIYEVIYELIGNTVAITYAVENTGSERMHFAVGGHPGFCVPLESGKDFSDYSLVFSEKCEPDRVGFTPTVYLSGCDERYPLDGGDTMHLTHEMFDNDAVILKNMAREVTLRCDGGERGLTVSYPDMPYLGIWHRPQTDAPYVCIEPWSSLPSRQDVVEEFTCKSDLLALDGGKRYENRWTVTVF